MRLLTMAALAAAWLFVACSSDGPAGNDAGGDPGVVDPGSNDPGGVDPGTADPGGADPGTVDPGTPDPGNPDPGINDPGPSDPGVDPDVPIVGPDYGEVFQSPDDQAVLQQHRALLDESRDMTADALFARRHAERPYLAGPGYDALKADGMDLIDGAYALDEAEKGMLQAKGFVVSGRLAFPSPPLAYQDLYQRDLPVLVTADSILFAIHKSYDLMLKQVEEASLIPGLSALLATLHDRVRADGTGASGVLGDAWSDVDLFYTVARSLLAGAPVDPVFAANAGFRDALLAQVDALHPAQIQLFGRAYPCADPLCLYDFSQFKPRGHYTDSEALQRYFKAMIWLGRTEIALTRFHRDFLAARLVLQTVRDAQALPKWSAIDRTIQVFVGRSDNLTMEGFLRFVEDQGAAAADLAALADPAVAQSLMAALEAGGYADQRILSQILAVDPMSDTPTPLPPIFEFLGQRFVIDSYVLGNVVFDRIVYQGHKVERMMPSPLDAMFVLGFQEALPLLRPELEKYPYAGNLNVLRGTVDAYDDAFWTESMYNVWLDAIRGLAADTSGAGMPDAARTLAYALKSMHAGLASWAELRHDTILYVKQSYTGASCDYPDGYVEPFPAFFHRIATFAQVSGALFDGLDLGTGAQATWKKTQVKAYFANLATVADTLAAIAEVEVAGQPRTPDQTAFLKSLVQDQGMCGGPQFSGWYADLFFDATDMTFELKPTIADVHTDPNSTQVLHVGTGAPNLMVMTVNTPCGLKAYAGPASSYYEHMEGGFNRLTDEDWLNLLTAGPVPPRPEWSAAFVAE